MSIVSHATIVGIPVGIAESFLTVLFTVTTGIVKQLLNITRKKKKKHNKILALAKNKLNIIETLLSQALIDFDISHEEFVKVINQKIKYERILLDPDVENTALNKENIQTTNLQKNL